ncbi:hypothetical protein [Aeromonas veronii]|uniref:hypothetical protein n=1 Tax=Aeromonas veronii TaxID=654 RepID=UPI003BA0E1C8
MDYARYDTPCTFYIEQQPFHLELNLPSGDKSLTEIFKTLAQVKYIRVQEYGTNEREKQQCTIKVLWHPKLMACTHVEVKTVYQSTMYKIELQQLPFNDGEVEILAYVME